MNNNFYDIPIDWYQNFNNLNNQNNNSLLQPLNGLERGNLFNNLYDPYKNYKYQELKSNNIYEEKLYNLLKYQFAMKDLELYLDIYPFDANIIKLYNNYLSEYNNAKNEYQKNYGPISLNSEYLNNNNWTWLNNNWPWEGTK